MFEIPVGAVRVTDDERREVAGDIRDMAVRPYIRYKEQFFDELADTVVGIEDYHDFDTVIEKLADLIDPTCVMRPVLEGFRCSVCGTYHDMSGFDEFPWPRCPECGARVVSR